MEQSTVTLIVAILTAGVSVVTWCLNERKKRIADEYKRRKNRYSRLIESAQGFYVASRNETDKTSVGAFLLQVNLCWMYCPDDVIRKAYEFLNTVSTEQKSSDDEKERALGEFILAIRRDLINRKPLKATTLTPQEFKHLRPTRVRDTGAQSTVRPMSGETASADTPHPSS